ncbi:hypothetical protein POTOM_042777 [Populus tomentosa]|uniref:Uncharacterized protein n=1 Tax=Populus tomentosa TaxID=118781 RepID=A0A8X7YKY2_POPTO|nr:hypothetical protein POTOM_042777 [Populus tomentosa]
MDDANFYPPPAQDSASGGYSLYAKGGAGQWRDSESHALHECWGISRSSSSSRSDSFLNRWCFGALSVRSVPTPSPLDHEGGLSCSYPVFLPSVAFTFVFAGLPPLVELLAAWAWTYGCAGCRDRLSLPDFQEPRVYFTEIADLLIMAWTILGRNSRPCLQVIYSVLLLLFSNRKDSKQDLWPLLQWGIHYFSLLSGFMLTDCAIKHTTLYSAAHVQTRLDSASPSCLVTKRSTSNITYLLKAKLKLLEDCSATPDPECKSYSFTKDVAGYCVNPKRDSGSHGQMLTCHVYPLRDLASTSTPELSIFNEKKVVHKTITHHAQQSKPNSLLNRYRRSDSSLNRWCFDALSVRSVPTPSPLHVDHEGGLSRSYPVFLPSVAFTFVFAGLPPLVELLAAWAWTYGCAGCRDRLSLPVFSLFVFLFFLSWQLDRFFVDGYAVVCGFISNSFDGRVFLSLSLEREDYQEPRVYLTEIADLLIMAWTILDRNSRPCLQAIYSVLLLLLLSNRKDSKQDLWPLLQWGIHSLCNKTHNAFFSS